VSEPDVDLDQVLRRRFGMEAFRPGQREAIADLLQHGALLAIQPTGYGKSLLYQLPAAILPGITIVISPLLALMRDQLGHLRDRFGIPAASINTDQSDEENDEARAAAAAGRVQLLFVSPEHLDHVDRFEAVARLPVSLLVIDEAHCISTWGHDFRPAYRQIVKLVHALYERRPGLRVLGLTATADARTERDIAAHLQRTGGPDLRVSRNSMDRPNLSLAVVPLEGLPTKLAYLAQAVGRLPGPGLLYCATREHAEIVGAFLKAEGQEVAAYHAGLDPDRKRDLQRDFLAGRFRAIAATNALGMGIDKSDLRYVVHVDVPGSITAYYQEVGRAGRDGKPARGILLFDPADERIQEHFIDSAQPSLEDFDAVLGAVKAEGLGLTALKVRTGLHPTRVTVVVAELVEQGFLVKRSQGGRQVYDSVARAGTPDLARYERQREVRRRELRAMLAYARLEVDCLMQTLRQALGDGAAPACARCSRCRGQASQIDPQATLARAQAWLQDRASVIAATARPEMSEGLALLDAELRSPLIAAFLRQRRVAGLPRTIADMLVRRAQELGGRGFAAVVLVPSSSWAQRQEVGALLAEALGVPALTDALVWKEAPRARQGELRNNDQRRQNVEGHMGLGGSRVPSGDVLLVDDYIGSGATLREAGRVLRQQAKLSGRIVPLTIARVRWRLGAAGMI
jgi:ATP-dependent DNA helicase RecQ